MSKKSPGRNAVTAKAPPRDRPRPASILDDRAQTPPPARPVVSPGELLRQGLHLLASLKLTVVLLLLSMGLVFFGTLAQVGNGVWTVVDHYFRSFYVWIPLKIFVHPSKSIPFGFPYPGGWTLGALLLLNLIAAHATRFKLSWRKSGVWLIHSGIIVMMLGELVTGLAQTEARMTIEEGKSSNFVEDHRKAELTFADYSDPKTDHVVGVPDSRLRHKGDRVSDPSLPADVEVVQYMVNSKLAKDAPARDKNPATAGIGLRSAVEELPEGAGVDQDQNVDLPSVYVKLFDKKSGKELGVWLISMLLKDQLITLDGKQYEVGLRFARSYLPYSFHLNKFTHDVYPGTKTPKDYRANVSLHDPETGTDRDIEIFMNAPLSYRGKTFYQSGFLPPETGMKGTILQVVHNPGWFMPYLSCILVTVGMMVHFGLALARFLSKPMPVRGGVA